MDIYLTEREFSERYHVSMRTLSRMRTDGSGPRFIRSTPGNIRGRILYQLAEIEQWLAGRTLTSTSDMGPTRDPSPVTPRGRRAQRQETTAT